MKILQILFTSLMLVLVVVLGANYVDWLQSPLPNTSRGSLIVPYDHVEYSLDGHGQPDSVTFVVGETVEIIGGHKRLIWYTFPYRSCRHDARLPFSSFSVHDGTVRTSWDLAVDRSPRGAM